MVRVKVTDDDAIIEYNGFFSSIDKVTVQNRHIFWVTQFVAITVSITLIYSFSFIQFWRDTNNNVPIFSAEVSN